MTGVSAAAVERERPSARGPRPALRGRVGPEILAVAAGLVVWETVARVGAFHFLPPFTRVFTAGVGLARAGVIGAHVVVSLSALLAGFALALAVGVALGSAMGRLRLLGVVLEPYVNALLAAPSLIFVPVLFIFFGTGGGTRVAVIFLYAVFIIVVNTAAGVRTADARLQEMARAFGASDWQVFWRIIAPGALPLTMAGIRLGAARAVKGMINGEMLIVSVGLGAQLRTYGGAFDAASVLAILLVVITVAVVISWLVRSLDRRLTWWAG